MQAKQRINAGGVNFGEQIQNTTTDAYGYVIRWQGVSSVKTVSQLLKQDIKLRFAEMPFEVNGQSFARGSVIILKKGNEKLGNNYGTIVSEGL